MLKKTTGIILRRKKIGEADTVLTIFTSDFGKITVIAKGIKRITSKRAGHLEPLMLSHLELRQSKNKNYLICEARTLDNFKKLRTDFNKTIIASYLTELVDQTAGFGEKNSEIFNLLKEALTFLGKTQKHKLPSLIYSYKIKLINLLGFKPELNHCLSCRKKVQDESCFFSFSEGGIFCSDCKPHGLNPIKLSNGTLKILRKLERSNFKKIISISTDENKKVGNVVDFYVEFILEKELESKKVIKKIKKDKLLYEIKK